MTTATARTPDQLSDQELLGQVLGERFADRLEQVPLYRLGGLRGTQLRAALLDDRRVQQLEAVLELGRRIAQGPPEPPPMRGPRDVHRYFGPRLSHLPHEEFHVGIMDAQHRIVLDVLVSKGLLNTALVHPREVFRTAIIERAASVVLVHNHPSGDPTPSQDDKSITTQLVAAGRLLDIPVNDHVVIGHGDRFVSFAEAGLL